jgi:predicted helicase
VLGFITNHGYLDNPTFRGMRWHLLKSFDKIYVLDLHGSSQKKEAPPNAPPDKNVFDIVPGVAIIIAVKNQLAAADGALARLERADLFGSRAAKYEWLEVASISDPKWEEIELRPPRYLFRSWDYDLEAVYERGFDLDDLFLLKSNGIVTGSDSTLVANSPDLLRSVISEKYGDFDPRHVSRLSYRPFETHYVYSDPNLIERGRQEVMRHYVGEKNIGLLVSKAVRDWDFAHVFLTVRPSEAIFLSGMTGSNAMNLPLYLYPSETELEQTRRVNFDDAIYTHIREVAKDDAHGEPDELAVFDYIN